MQAAALDPFRGRKRCLSAGLPEATVVLDAFHAVRLAQQVHHDVRHRVQDDTLGHRGRKGDPPYPACRGVSIHTTVAASAITAQAPVIGQLGGCAGTAHARAASSAVAVP